MGGGLNWIRCRMNNKEEDHICFRAEWVVYFLEYDIPLVGVTKAVLHLYGGREVYINKEDWPAVKAQLEEG